MASRTPEQLQAPSPAAPSEPAASIVLRFLRIFVLTVLGFALFIIGIVWLIDGIESQQAWSILGGVIALTIVGGWVIRALMNSRRELQRQAELAAVKSKAGLRSCGACKIDFEEATSVKTPKRGITRL